MSADRAVALRTRNPALDGAVIERLVGALAARADLPVDRLEDARMLAATVIELARPLAAGEHLDAALDAHGETITLHVGPLVPGGAEGVVDRAEVAGVGNLVALLGGGWEAGSDGDGDGGSERLRVMLTPAAPGRTG